jgi:hypothetical protein
MAGRKFIKFCTDVIPYVFYPNSPFLTPYSIQYNSDGTPNLRGGTMMTPSATTLRMIFCVHASLTQPNPTQPNLLLSQLMSVKTNFVLENGQTEIYKILYGRYAIRNFSKFAFSDSLLHLIPFWRNSKNREVGQWWRRQPHPCARSSAHTRHIPNSTQSSPFRTYVRPYEFHNQIMTGRK